VLAANSNTDFPCEHGERTRPLVSMQGIRSQAIGLSGERRVGNALQSKCLVERVQINGQY
jgi:hypothetical protein